MPAFVFLTPLESNWAHLNTVIPNVLHLSVIGFPFVNPGPVGGKGTDPEANEPAEPVAAEVNGDGDDDENRAVTQMDLKFPLLISDEEKRQLEAEELRETPDREMELYIRWWQVNTFMPMLNFYRPPSVFQPEKVAEKFLFALLFFSNSKFPRYGKDTLFARKLLWSESRAFLGTWVFQLGADVNRLIDKDAARIRGIQLP